MMSDIKMTTSVTRAPGIFAINSSLEEDTTCSGPGRITTILL